MRHLRQGFTRQKLKRPDNCKNACAALCVVWQDLSHSWASVIVSSGCPGFQWLKALNASNRSSRPAFSTMGKRLDSDRSALICPGARIALRDELPKYPHAGCVKVLSVEPASCVGAEPLLRAIYGHLGARGIEVGPLRKGVVIAPLSLATIVKGNPPWKDERTPTFQPPMASSTSFEELPRIAFPWPMGRA